MSDARTGEKISALIDREVSESEMSAMFARMRTDHAARETWHAYHLIGGVLRGEVKHCGRDLSARISARVEAESAHCVDAESADNVVRMRLPQSRREFGRESRRESGRESRQEPMQTSAQASPQNPRRKTARRAAALALAASLALLAVFALRAPSPPPQVTARADTAFERELDLMLLQHGEFAFSPGLRGLMVYAKLVGDRRPHPLGID